MRACMHQGVKSTLAAVHLLDRPTLQLLVGNFKTLCSFKGSNDHRRLLLSPDLLVSKEHGKALGAEKITATATSIDLLGICVPGKNR